MRTPKQHEGLLASAMLIVVLAIATFFSTKSADRLLRSDYKRASATYESLVNSIDLSDLSGHRGNSFGGIEERNFGSEDRSDEGFEEVDQDPFEGIEQGEFGSEGREEGEFGSEGREEGESGSEDHFFDEEFEEVEEAILEADDDDTQSQRTDSILKKRNAKPPKKRDGAPLSPACHPHFNLALPDNQWSNATKFKRIYFYHARKAGGSSLHKYLAKVAEHYGLELKATEWSAMEEPGTYLDGATFYVTHLREPVDRSISHFKYQGRWNCRDLVYHEKRDFTPTEENANKLETWNKTGGHVPYECKMRRSKGGGKKKQPIFFLGNCAVNCYTQWFSGLSCATWEIPLEEQYAVAKEKVLRYNFIAVIEKLKDPAYVKAVERFFGVPGITDKGSPYCEKQSHEANSKFPLVVRDKTRERLTKLNRVDLSLYHELSDCLEGSKYNNFPKWNPNRFDLHTYNITEAKAAMKKAKAAKKAQQK